MSLFTSLLHDWQGFFQMTAECSATLIGLMFVVATQTGRLFEARAMGLVNSFLTPILGYYIGALLISAMLCIPNQTQRSLFLAICFFTVGRSLFLIRSTSALLTYHRRAHLEKGKWSHHVVQPAFALLFTLLSGFVVLHNATIGLDVVAIGVLVNLLKGISEAWRLTLTMASATPEEIKRMHQAYFDEPAPVA